MDLRVLAAVFLTLSAVAVGMEQGDLEVKELTGLADSLRDSGDLTELLQRAGNRSYNTTISGSITSSAETELDIGAPADLAMDVPGSADIRVGDSTLRTSGDSRVTAEGFQGTVRVSPDNLTVQGTVRGISTSSFDFSYSSPKDFSVESNRSSLELSGLKRQTFELSNATGTVRAGGTTVEVDGERAWFEEFSGNLSVEGSSYSVRGTVRSALLGDAEIG